MSFSQDYSVKSNARRAARAAGVDPELVTACKGGFHFPLPAAKAGKPEGDDLDIPEFFKLTPEQRKTARDRQPPAKSSVSARKTISMPKGKKGSRKVAVAKGGSKTALVLSMLLDTRGATMPEITKATGWLPHTARARISGIVKKEKLSISRERLLGVSTYKATRKKG